MPNQLHTTLAGKLTLVTTLAVVAIAVVAASGALAGPSEPHDASSATTSTGETVTPAPDRPTRPAATSSHGHGSALQGKLPSHHNRQTGPAGPDPTPDPDTPEPESRSPFGGTRQFGVATASNAWNNTELEQVERVTGHAPTIVLHYLGFVDELNLAQLDNVRAYGAMPLLTWEPFDWRAGGVDQPRYRLRNIANGRFDAYLTRTAATIAAYGDPVLLRFAHEMNGSWYPWSEQVNGNRPGEYIAAWRHVHELFTEFGVDNVTWVWSPNVEFVGSQPLAELYPGHGYVDAIALDGYNWGATAPSGWQTPGEVFDDTLATVRRLSPGTPLLIGETAASDEGGDKAAWNGSLFAWLRDQPDIEALVWFHLDKEAAWRIDSTPESATALASGLAHWLG
jgi:hypothetical protein